MKKLVTVDLSEFSSCIREGMATQTSEQNALEQLADDESPEVCARVVLNPHALPHTIAKLRLNNNPIVQDALRRRESGEF